MKGMKKVLAATLAATMVMSSALTVCAADTYDSQNYKRVSETVIVGDAAEVTHVKGVYAAKSIKGAAVIDGLQEVRASMGLTGNQNPVIRMYDMEEKKCPDAMVSVDGKVSELNAVMTACLSIDLGAKDGKNWLNVTEGSATLKVGLPKNADTDATYSVIYVKSDGSITVLQDQDSNDKTVTFKIGAGVGAYAIVKGAQVQVIPAVVPAAEETAETATEATTETTTEATADTTATTEATTK